jgi:ABC-2 type transport system permease protein
MKRIFNIAWKDILIALRDPVGLVLMLVAPIALTLVTAFAFGGLGGGTTSGGLQEIQVAIYNQDQGTYGAMLVNILDPDSETLAANPDLQPIADLLAPTVVTGEAEARRLIDDEQYAAAVIIPPGFSGSIVPSDPTQPAVSSTIEIYANPARLISASVVNSIVQGILDQMAAGSVSGRVAASSLIMAGRLDPAASMQALLQTVAPVTGAVRTEAPIELEVESLGRQTNSGGFDWLSYMAPSMAVLFLMFTMSTASRSILAEKQYGTLPRMLVSPTSRASVLGGKMLGVYCIGLLQMVVLILSSRLIFNISYGPLLLVLPFTLVLVAAATAWGMLEAAFSKSSGQANALGWALNLVFAALAGNFVPRTAYPAWLQKLGLLTPNAWGIDSYYKLIHGGTFADILPALLVLGGMTVVIFLVAVLVFRKRFA